MYVFFWGGRGLEFDFYFINWTRADFAPQIQINKYINKKIARNLSDLMNRTCVP